MFENAMRELDSGVWAEHNPSRCPCGGRGWMGSDFDTWHRCPIHGVGVPHPEDEEAFFNHVLHTLEVRRAAWRHFQVRSGLLPRVFRSTVEHRLAMVGSAALHPQDWVDAAETVSDERVTEMLEERARRMGYSCRLEAAWAAEAQVEAEARSRHMDPDVYATRGSPERADADSWYH
jgi:hypothetical protein